MRTSTIFGILFAAATSWATVINVPADYATIQGGMGAAADGDTVRIQPGTYVEQLDFLGKAICVMGTAPEDSAVVATTVVDGAAAGSVVRFVGGEGRDSRLVGLTIQGGTGTIIDRGRAGQTSTAGGGVYVVGAEPSIEHCFLRANRALGRWGIAKGGRGAGIYAEDAAPLLRDCRIERNESESFGGGMTAAGNSDLALEGSIVVDNYAGYFGGGIDLRAGARAWVVGSRVIGNHGPKDGGGIFVKDAVLSAEATIIAQNRAEDDYGGGLELRGGAAALLRACVIAENHAGSHGGGLRVTGATMFMENCTLAGNSAEHGGGGLALFTGAEVQVVNSVLWYNLPDQIETLDARPLVRYSSVKGGWPGVGNIVCGPRFKTYRGLPLLLGPGSDCVDAGEPALEDAISDWHPRWPPWYPDAPRSDMGAYGGPANRQWLRGIEAE